MDVETDPGQQPRDVEVDVAISGEAVIRQLQRRAAIEISQLITENAELRAINEALKSEYAAWRARAEAYEQIIAEATS